MTDKTSLAQQIFGANAASYVTSRTHAQGASLNRLIELTAPQATWRVLDVATGAGHTALAFAPHVAHVIASDVTPQMLAQTDTLAQERGLINVTTQLADAEQLPFDNGSFDLVTCRIAPHHFDDVQRFIHECARVLKPGGLLAVVDNVAPEDAEAARYIDDYERTRDASHARCLPPREWRTCFESARLTMLHIEMIDKPIGFEEWCGHQKTPPDVMATLRNMLVNAPDAAKAQLKPTTVEGRLKFSMVEGIFAGRREQEADATSRRPNVQ